MKKILISLITLTIILVGCSDSNNTIDTSIKEDSIIETTADITSNIKNTIENIDTNVEGNVNVIESLNRLSNRASFSFDANNKFVYTGEDEYIKEVVEVIKNELSNYFDQENAVEIPVPYIVRIDDEDRNNIKVFGDFYVYGYNMEGMLFVTKNAGSFPGCIHFKEENEKIVFDYIEIADDGSNNDASLLKICEDDERLKEDINNARIDDGENLRIEYVKMYAKDNNLNVAGIKDYGWPVILFNDISDAEFLFNFYDSYFDEIRQEDSLNDFEERISNLKKKYIIDEVLAKIDNQIKNTGFDPMIGANDLTETMIDTMKVDDYGNGNLIVSMDILDDENYKINVKIDNIDGKKKIIDLAFNK